MKKEWKMLGYGVLTWLIPFVAGVIIMPLVNQDVFKSLLIVISAATGCWLLVDYFKSVKKDTLNEGIKVGLSWFAINIVLDILTLILMFDMPVQTYVEQIGIRYLMIPIMSAAVGASKRK